MQPEQTETNKTHQWVRVWEWICWINSKIRHSVERRVTTDKREMNLFKYWFKNKTDDKLFSCKLIADFSIIFVLCRRPARKNAWKTTNVRHHFSNLSWTWTKHEWVWNGHRNINKYSTERLCRNTRSPSAAHRPVQETERRSRYSEQHKILSNGSEQNKRVVPVPLSVNSGYRLKRQRLQIII